MEIKDVLKNIGLTEKEIIIYSVLLEKGEQKIADLLKTSNLKRGDLYYALDNLEKRKLIIKEDKKKKLHFRLNHPQVLEKLLEEREKQIKSAEAELSAALPAMISTFNLVDNQPGVKVFEGEEGLKKLMDDSLTAENEILSYVDPASVDKFIQTENKRYVLRRHQKNIKKRILAANTPYNRTRYTKSQNSITKVRLMPADFSAFATTIQIYNNKISYQNYKTNALLGVIIEDQMIVKFERALFEMIWKNSKPL